MTDETNRSPIWPVLTNNTFLLSELTLLEQRNSKSKNNLDLINIAICIKVFLSYLYQSEKI